MYNEELFPVLRFTDVGHVRYLSISVHTISVPKSMCSVPRDHFGTCQVQYNWHVQFGTGHFWYQDQFGTNVTSISFIYCNALY